MSERPPLRALLTDPVLFIAFGAGAGLSPKLPGTIGTLWGVPLFLLMSRLTLPAYLLTTAVLAVAGVWLCGVAARRLGVHDHSGIVWDEIIGYLVTMLPLAIAHWRQPGINVAWSGLLAGLLLFRVFDILKPGPIRWLDRHVTGGIGIILDDIAAALPAAAVLAVIMTFVPLTRTVAGG